jgi:hypothetical protein
MPSPRGLSVISIATDRVEGPKILEEAWDDMLRD